MFQLLNLVIWKWAELATTGVRSIAEFRQVVSGDIYVKRA